MKYLFKRKPVRRQNKPMREALYAKMDRFLDGCRTGLKELTADIIYLRFRGKSLPQSPMQRYK